jgi:hypothetical protein
MAKFKALPRGAQLVLVAGPLVFFSLFFTWQNVEVDYGPAGVATLPLDGWDAWGLLLAVLVLTAVTIVALANLTEVEMSEDIPWRTIVLGLGVAVFAVALLKNVTDAGSSWWSYGFVALAGVVALGAYLDWAEARGSRHSLVAQARSRGRIRSAA